MSPRRLLLDLSATQSAAHADRGIARYVKEHARALLRRGAVAGMALSADLPFPRLLDLELLASPLLDWSTRTAFRRVLERDDGPLAYHVMSPFEISAHAEGDLPPHLLRPDLPLVVTLYDLIPLLAAERYLADELVAQRYRARLEVFRQADLVLTISEHTRADALEHLGLPAVRVRSIGAGVSAWFHPTTAPGTVDLLLGRALPALRRPFVLTVLGGDERKNAERLFTAWAAVDPALRRDLTLVVACHVDRPIRAAWQAELDGLGLAPDDVVVTGYVADEVLRALYQRARLFVFPSLYEGYGLPAAEAIACGCPVVTSGASSLPEVLDWAPSTFDPTDVGAMAAAVERGLTDEGFRAELVERGAARVASLTWEAVAERTLDAVASVLPAASSSVTSGSPRHASAVTSGSPPHASSVTSGSPPHASAVTSGSPPQASARPLDLPLRLALVGPMPPQLSGIAEYNARLVPELARRAELDVFTPACRPTWPPADGVRWFPIGALGRTISPWAYDAVVFTVGNSDDHHDLYDLAQELPGVLWLHDVRLAGLYVTYARARLGEPAARDFLRGRLLQQYRRRTPAGLVDLDLATEPVAYGDQGVGMTAELVGVARAVVVTSDLAARLLALDAQPDGSRPSVTVIPNAVPVVGAGTDVDGGGGPVVASFGLVSPMKLPDLLVEAVARLGPDVRLVLVGPVDDGDRARLEATAELLGMGDRLVLTGAVPREVYDGWLRRADVAVQLRRTTNGESSAALLDCVAAGLPAVTNAPTELPRGTVASVPHDVEADELAACVGSLLVDESARAPLRAASARYAEGWTFAHAADRLLEVVRSL